MKSIVDQSDLCFFCGKPKEAEHHLVFGMSLRNIAENDGIKIGICNTHHNMGEITRRIHGNTMAERMSKMIGQLVWEKHEIAEKGITEEEARKKFIERYGRNFI